jgi:hypothetical protein
MREFDGMLLVSIGSYYRPVLSDECRQGGLVWRFQHILQARSADKAAIVINDKKDIDNSKPLCPQAFSSFGHREALAEHWNARYREMACGLGVPCQ